MEASQESPMPTTVRCPSERCSDLFEVPERRLGRNMFCPSCGVRLTAIPAEVRDRLAAQEATTPGAEGAAVERLPVAVIVDNVRSLWNVGSIFRTADACGVERLVLTGITGCPPRPEIAKTALGAEEAVAWTYRADAVAALVELVDEGYAPVALETTERSVPVDVVPWPRRPVLVIGNEVAGVSPTLLEACRHHASIPMRGVKQSLNVAVAFGIAAYHAARALDPTRSVAAS
jgi:tRNA G18 (ribose-2'-O)-methylase SpoU